MSLVLLLLSFVPFPGSQLSATEPVVRVDGETLFVLHSGVGSVTPTERAEIVNRRLQEILNSLKVLPEMTVQRTDVGWVVLAGTAPIISVTENDARAEGVDADVLAQRWATEIQGGLLRASRSRLRHTLGRRLLITSLVLLAALLLFFLLRFSRRRITRGLEAKRERIPSLQVRGFELLPADKLARALTRALQFTYVGLVLLVLSAAVLLVFAQFPVTQGYARQVGRWIWTPVADIGRGVLEYLPNLFYILVIALVARMGVRTVGFLFDQAERGTISLEPWVHQDVAGPTGKIVKAVIIVLVLFFIAPLIPGTGSTAAKGLSVIIGLMVSFGSTSTVGNAIAGIVLSYMRPFRIGDRVKIGDAVGDVLERTFLHTKLRTIKNEQVIVPSLQALSGAIINYSAEAQGPGLILHTSVTIGYDAPWRTVHELLLRAAAQTRHVLKDPNPFVLQTSLDDFFITYELNAYTNRPNQMVQIYSDLHQNIQDCFNEGGVEIMSPHYSAVRDGNQTTIPENYLPKNYLAPGFRILPSDNPVMRKSEKPGSE